MASEIKVDTIVNAGGDNDSGIDLATNDNIKFKIAGSEKARMDSSGNILVGKTSSVFNNDGIELKADDTVVVTKDGGIALFLNRKTSHGGLLAFDKDGTTMGQIDSSSGNLLIRTAGNYSGIRFDANGLTPFKNGSEDDDAIDLGYAGGRFDDLFATNGTIQTSDQNEKQDIASATAKELNVAKKLSTLFKTFRWKSKVTEKGDKARIHSGIVAQEVQAAFNAEGLDASKYGLFTSDTWWEENETFTDDDGKEKTRRVVYRTEKEATSTATKKTRLGVRYPELFSFIFSSIEARLTALESK
tara:strand:- start:417 stop:1319 length:903 start_codon:yes stop_codon:yes gene_type:complete